MAAGFGAKGRVPGLDRAATGGSEKRTQVFVTTTRKVMLAEIFTQIGSVIVSQLAAPGSILSVPEDLLKPKNRQHFTASICTAST